MNKSLKELVEYIKNSIDILVSIKLGEELKKYKFSNETSNPASDYEKLLQKSEQHIRAHIRLEFQLKIQCEKYCIKLDNLEEEKNSLIAILVRHYYL